MPVILKSLQNNSQGKKRYMSRVCTITKRRPQPGYKYTTRGIAKKKKGIGIKITGKTKERFLPNLKKKRLWDETKKAFVKMRISTAAMRLIDKKGLTAALAKD